MTVLWQEVLQSSPQLDILFLDVLFGSCMQMYVCVSKVTSVSDIHSNVLPAFLISPKTVHATAYLSSLILHLSFCGIHSSELNSFSASQENPTLYGTRSFIIMFTRV